VKRLPSDPKPPHAKHYAEKRIRRMAETLGSSYKVVMSKSRRHDVTMIRHIIAYQLRKKYGMTLQAVADALGKQNHATTSNSVNVIEGLIEIGDRRVLEMIGKL